MPGPLEPRLMLKFSIKYAEARTFSSDGRKNLGMGRFEPWTPELEAECTRLFNEKWDPVKEKIEQRPPPVDPSISKDRTWDENLTESTSDLSVDESEDVESCVREQESCSVATIPSTVEEKVEPRSYLLRSLFESSILKGTSCDEDLTESTEDLSDTEREDEESCVQEHESCSVVAMPSTVGIRRKEKKTKSQAPKSAIHSFFGNLFGDRLNDCNLIVDNAKMATNQAIDFDALVRKRLIREEKYRLRKSESRRGGRRPSRVATDNRFLAIHTPPAPSSRPPIRKYPAVMLLQDFQTTLDTCEKKGSSGAPKAPQRRESADDDDAFWLDVKRLQKSVKQITTAL
jgi:hypothetical protein